MAGLLLVGPLFVLPRSAARFPPRHSIGYRGGGCRRDRPAGRVHRSWSDCPASGSQSQPRHPLAAAYGCSLPLNPLQHWAGGFACPNRALGPAMAATESYRDLGALACCSSSLPPRLAAPCPPLGGADKSTTRQPFRFPAPCERPEYGVRPAPRAAHTRFSACKPLHLCRSEQFELPILTTRSAGQKPAQWAGGTQTHGRRIMNPLGILAVLVDQRRFTPFLQVRRVDQRHPCAVLVGLFLSLWPLNGP